MTSQRLTDRRSGTGADASARPAHGRDSWRKATTSGRRPPRVFVGGVQQLRDTPYLGGRTRSLIGKVGRCRGGYAVPGSRQRGRFPSRGSCPAAEGCPAVTRCDGHAFLAVHPRAGLSLELGDDFAVDVPGVAERGRTRSCPPCVRVRLTGRHGLMLTSAVRAGSAARPRGTDRGRGSTRGRGALADRALWIACRHYSR